MYISFVNGYMFFLNGSLYFIFASGCVKYFIKHLIYIQYCRQLCYMKLIQFLSLIWTLAHEYVIWDLHMNLVYVFTKWHFIICSIGKNHVYMCLLHYVAIVYSNTNFFWLIFPLQQNIHSIVDAVLILVYTFSF